MTDRISPIVLLLGALGPLASCRPPPATTAKECPSSFPEIQNARDSDPVDTAKEAPVAAPHPPLNQSEKEGARVAESGQSVISAVPSHYPADWEARYRAKADFYYGEALDGMLTGSGTNTQLLALSELSLHYAEAVKDERLIANALYVLGWSLGRVERYKEGLKALDRALELNKRHYEADHLAIGNIYLHQGWIRRAMGQEAAALQLFRKHLTFNQGMGGWCESVAITVARQCTGGYKPACKACSEINSGKHSCGDDKWCQTDW